MTNGADSTVSPFIFAGMQEHDCAFRNMPVIETQRLVLRKLCMKDARDMFEVSRDPEVARYVLWRPYTELNESKHYIRHCMRQYKLDQPAPFGMYIKEDCKVIGTIGFTWVNRDHNSAEVGYSMSRMYWNRGLMTEALSAVIEYGMTDMRLNRIEAQHDIRNPPSGKVMEKCGMKREGTLYGRLYSKGEYIDVNLYAILRKDYMRVMRV